MPANSSTAEDWTERFVDRAIVKFGDRGDGMFNTAGYQSAVREEFGIIPPTDSVNRALLSLPDVVQLSGGCHWRRIERN
jgi:hypothetical protein